MQSTAVASALAVLATVSVSGGVDAAAKHDSAQAPLYIVPSPIGDFTDNFSPYAATPNYGVQGLIYEPLFYFDNISGHTFDLLGTKFAWSNGDKTLTVNIRPGVKWSDGQPFTVRDVVFTYDMLKRYPDADTTGIWQVLSSVAAKGSLGSCFSSSGPTFRLRPMFLAPISCLSISGRTSAIRRRWFWPSRLARDRTS